MFPLDAYPGGGRHQRRTRAARRHGASERSPAPEPGPTGRRKTPARSITISRRVSAAPRERRHALRSSTRRPARAVLGRSARRSSRSTAAGRDHTARATLRVETCCSRVRDELRGQRPHGRASESRGTFRASRDVVTRATALQDGMSSQVAAASFRFSVVGRSISSNRSSGYR